MASSKRELQKNAAQSNSISNGKDAVKPSDEQVAILDHFRSTGDNLLIGALAGCAKTTMLEMLMAITKEPTLYLAFSKAVIDEAKENERIPNGVTPATFNSMGLKCWGQGNGKAITNPKKPFEILGAVIDEIKGKDKAEVREAYWDILSAIRMAKNLGYVPDGKFAHARRLCDRETLCSRIENRLSPLCLSVVDHALTASIKASYEGSVDFDDQVYMPALFGGSFPRFPLVLVDEDQDLSPANHALLQKLVKGRVGAVGDRWQSIYYFRGAETNGVDKIKTHYNMHEMPLSVSFRCPENIVKAVHWRVPHMRWIKTGGVCDKLSSLDPAGIPEGSAIICRNNAPLFRAAFALLSRKRSVQVAGSDVGPKIIRLLGKVGNPGDTSEDLLYKIDAWQNSQLETTNSPATVMDTAECMKIFASWGNTLDQAIGYAKHIFAQQGKIELTTGHKAKGREWDTVYHLDKFLLSKEEQDLNLSYVITTRAKQELFEITTKELQW
jgi:DNA helicase II / ATP-dependent DNA helicase PcrA